ncbi:MAG: hypothetical protein PHE09_00265 [Oscillospiraceae bacterium]|nr:hypothetical protein [Oscillospiraceae bacterium]
MKKGKPISVALYSLAGIIVIVAVVLFTNLFAGRYIDFGDLGEFTGTALAVTMGFEMMLLVATWLLKHKLVPDEIKTYFVALTKIIRQFHYPIGALGISILLLHLGLTIDLNNLWQGELVTGYFTALTIIFSALVGSFFQSKKKAVRTAHIILAIVAVLPFLLHIA